MESAYRQHGTWPPEPVRLVGSDPDDGGLIYVSAKGTRYVLAHKTVGRFIRELAGNQARIALLAIAEGKTLFEALDIADTFPAERS